MSTCLSVYSSSIVKQLPEHREMSPLFFSAPLPYLTSFKPLGFLKGELRPESGPSTRAGLHLLSVRASWLPRLEFPQPPWGLLVCRYCPQPAVNPGPFIDFVCLWLHCVCQSPFLTLVVSRPGGIVEGN